MFIAVVPDSIRFHYPHSKISDIDELLILINGRHTVLDIRNTMDVHFPKKSDLWHILNYLEILKRTEPIED